MEKLKLVKKELRLWNVREFGKVEEKILLSQLKLQKIQSLMSAQGFSEELYSAECNNAWIWSCREKSYCLEINAA